MKHIFFIILFTFISLSASAFDKARADSLYGAEHYNEAAKEYNGLLKEGVASDIYYNLGNCYYKMDSIPLAILNYERAYMLSPGDADIRNNLAFARSKTVDRLVPPSRMFFINWWNDFTHLQSIDAWTTQAIILFVLSLISLFVYFMSFDIRVRKVSFTIACVFMAIVILQNIAAYSQYSEMHNHVSAIIMDPAVSVKSSPSHNSTDLFIIHEGSKVEILDNSMQNWIEVQFEEGKQGWIPSKTVEII